MLNLTTFKLSILLMVTTYTLSNPWKLRLTNLLSHCGKLSTIEKSAVRNWCNIRFNKSKLTPQQYENNIKEFSQLTKSPELCSLTGTAFNETNFGKTITEIEQVNKYSNNVSDQIVKVLDGK